MSIDQMLKWLPGRRDDMESLGYTIMSLCGNDKTIGPPAPNGLEISFSEH